MLTNISVNAIVADEGQSILYVVIEYINFPILENKSIRVIPSVIE